MSNKIQCTYDRVLVITINSYYQKYRVPVPRYFFSTVPVLRYNFRKVPRTGTTVLLRSTVPTCGFVHSEARMPSLARLSKRFRAPGTNGRLDLNLTWRVSEDPLTDHTRYDRDPEIHGKARRVSLPFGEAQLAGCLRVQVGGPLKWNAGIQ